MMQTLYIDRKSTQLEVDKARLLIREPDQRRPLSVPLVQLERLVLLSDVSLTSRVLFRLGEAGVTVVCLHSQTSSAAILQGHSPRDAERHQAQYRVVSSPVQSLALAVTIVTHRLRGQQHVLVKALRVRPELRKLMMHTRQELQDTEQRLLTQPPSTLAELLGVEGQAAARYFAAYRMLFADSLGFDERNRRPPRDPVNVALSLGYTLLHAETLRALHGVGLNPLLGVYHQPVHGRESLACDVDELLRADVEQWVWRMFANQDLRVEDFASSEERPCELMKAGRARFYAEHAARVVQWRRRLRRIARYCVQQLPAWQAGV